MLHIAGRTGWFEHLAAGSPPSTACPPAAHHSYLPFYFFFIATTMSLKLHSPGHTSYQNHPAAGHSETRAGCQIPGRQLGSAGIPMWRRWKLLPASASLSVNDEHLRWGTVTVKIANCNNKSFHQTFCTTLGNFPSNCRNLFKGFFFWQTNAWSMCWMGSCHCCSRDCLAEEEVAVLPDNLPLLCSGSSVPASNFSSWFFFLLLWGQLLLCMQCSSNSCQLSGSSQHFQRLLTLYAFFVCVPTVREMSGFLTCLIGNAMTKLKWVPDKELAWEFAWDLW